MKILVLLGMLCLALVSCGGETPEVDPWPYILVEVETDNGAGGSFKLPGRFDPATGEYTAVCGETVHEEDCPFWSGDYYDPNFTVWRDVLFRAEKQDNTYSVCAYNMTTGEERMVTETAHPGSFQILGDYLFVGNALGITERICLTDGTEAENPAGVMPDWVTGETAYYTLRGARGRDGGLYRQNLYETGSRPPMRELLFADAVVLKCWYGDEAVFWVGNHSLYEEGTHLYRYDLRTRTNTVLQENFDGNICVTDSEWLYSVTDNALWRIHRETGQRMLLYEPEELKLVSSVYNRIQEAGGYIIMEAGTTGDEKAWGRLVYHPGTGEAVFYPNLS